MFCPDLTLREIKGTMQLEKLYRKLNILWPYVTFLGVRDSVTHFVVASVRKKVLPTH